MVGDIVLVADYGTPRNTWPIGKVTEVFPDKYGLVRSVNVRCRMKILYRPVNKLCLLEAS